MTLMNAMSFVYFTAIIIVLHSLNGLFCENGHAFRHVRNVFWFVIYDNIHMNIVDANAFEIDSSITNQSNTHGHIHFGPR